MLEFDISQLFLVMRLAQFHPVSQLDDAGAQLTPLIVGRGHRLLDMIALLEPRFLEFLA